MAAATQGLGPSVLRRCRRQEGRHREAEGEAVIREVAVVARSSPVMTVVAAGRAGATRSPARRGLVGRVDRVGRGWRLSYISVVAEATTRARPGWSGSP